MNLPDVRNWKHWTYEDYLWFFLSRKGTRSRLRGSNAPLEALQSEHELREFLAPLRERIKIKYSTDSPRVSIALVAYNEERQLIPTLLSYTCLDCPNGLAEIIVVDNNSTDRTREIVEACGAKYVHCSEQGTPYARAAGIEAASSGTEYIWMSDADARVVKPFDSKVDLTRKGTVFQTSYGYMEEDENRVGVSTGILLEDAHFSYWIIHELAVLAGWTDKYVAWAGANQFVRKSAMEAIGGIDTSVLYGEDYRRLAQLARWANAHDKHIGSVNMDGPPLGDPVYVSGRRYATLGRVAKHTIETLTRDYRSHGEEWTDISHKKHVDWQHYR